MGRPDLAESGDYRRNPDRIRNIGPLDDLIVAWFAAQPYDAIAAVLKAHEVPFSKVFTIVDVIDDPHLKAREAIVRLEDADLGTIPAPCAVPRFSGYQPSPPRSGIRPRVSTTRPSMARSGVTAADLAALKSAGVVRMRRQPCWKACGSWKSAGSARGRSVRCIWPIWAPM